MHDGRGDVKIKGKDKFLAQISALPQAIRDEVASALETSAEETTDLMRRFAPKRTGRLALSIGYGFGDAPAGSLNTTVANARAAKAESGLSVTMYAGSSEAYWARWNEFGTVKMAANPFFYPGFRFGKKRAKDRLSRAIRNGARKAFGK
ncbi:MAG: HK97 gp10 family phage protein [Mesorhizobium sp.]|nr:MAG: HK97 gp10 family phage protein [Mesorhizobium sp.]